MLKFIKFGAIFFLLLSVYGLASAQDDDDEAEIEDEDYVEGMEESTEESAPTTMTYESPKVKGFVNFAEPFDTPAAMKRLKWNPFSADHTTLPWKISEAKKDGVDEEISKYNGRWEVTKPIQTLLEGDLGLLLKDKARHNAISVQMPKPYDFDGKPFVMQYEVNFQEGIECGGGYVKLLSNTKDLDLQTFNDKTPYTIMFGPDKCGEDYKLHFIFQHKNPKTGKYEEKHAKKTTTDLKGPYGDKAFHLYTLVVNPDNSFKIYIDQKEVNSGSLLEDMTPAVNPPKEIEDKDDKKPEDWDEREKIPDPDATKPEDWDEDAPAKIPDPNAEMPEGWLEDEPLYVDDPDAQRPEDWDDDMDGEWEPPMVENPKCKDAPGCGTWEPDDIPNPDFKGKWRAPLITNPAYKGIWKPRNIPNPDFFEDLHPYKMTSIGAIGLELWSMSSSIMFDNFVITNDKAVADDYASQTWKLKKAVRAKNEPGIVQSIMDAPTEKPWLWAVYAVVIALPLILLYTCCKGGSKADESHPKKTDEPTPDDPHDSEKEETEENQEEKEQQNDSQEDKPAAGDAKKKPSKEDLEDDADEENVDDEEEEEEEEEDEPPKSQTENRKSPRRRVRKSD